MEFKFDEEVMDMLPVEIADAIRKNPEKLLVSTKNANGDTVYATSIVEEKKPEKKRRGRPKKGK